jgi:hypothetical protein
MPTVLMTCQLAMSDIALVIDSGLTQTFRPTTSPHLSTNWSFTFRTLYVRSTPVQTVLITLQSFSNLLDKCEDNRPTRMRVGDASTVITCKTTSLGMENQQPTLFYVISLFNLYLLKILMQASPAGPREKCGLRGLRHMTLKES